MVLENTHESPLDCKEIQPVHPKGDQSWIIIGRTDAEAEAPILWPSWFKELTHLKRPWCWERLKVGGEGNNREWNGWMASLTQCTWVWVNSRSWWWTGRPDVLQSMGLQRVGHYWATKLNWTKPLSIFYHTIIFFSTGAHALFSLLDKFSGHLCDVAALFVLWRVTQESLLLEVFHEPPEKKSICAPVDLEKCIGNWLRVDFPIWTGDESNNNRVLRLEAKKNDEQLSKKKEGKVLQEGWRSIS